MRPVQLSRYIAMSGWLQRAAYMPPLRTNHKVDTSRKKSAPYAVCTHERVGTLDDLIYNDLLTYAVIVLNGDSKAHLEVVTEYQPLDQAQFLS